MVNYILVSLIHVVCERSSVCIFSRIEKWFLENKTVRVKLNPSILEINVAIGSKGYVSHSRLIEYF